MLDVPSSPMICCSQRAACVVSIKTREEICALHWQVEPMLETSRRTHTHAILSATRAHAFCRSRFDADLCYSVDVLSPPESARFEELDPKIYGLIVEDDEGRRGLLLPDLEGVEAAEQQLQIAARKAGIPPGADVTLYRFRVRRYGE